MSKLNKLHKGAKVTLTVGDTVIAESECLALFNSILGTMIAEARKETTEPSNDEQGPLEQFDDKIEEFINDQKFQRRHVGPQVFC